MCADYVAFAMEKYIHAFWHITGTTFAHLEKIDTRFGDFEYAWRRASGTELRAAGLAPDYCAEVLKRRISLDIGKAMQRLWDLDVALVGRGNPEYPKPLSQIHSPPFLLYRKGAALDKLNNRIAIVGTRKSSIERERLTFKLAKLISDQGMCVVSGLAFGIDASAHSGVLEGSGKTIGVLASGIEKVTPTSHINLSNKILESGGAIISEYPVTSPAMKYQFLERNRIISGMSKCVIVVEAAKKSGALITAGHAADQGRDVLAFPGDPGKLGTAGCNALIKSGARLVDSITDVITLLAESGYISNNGAAESKQMNLDLVDQMVMKMLGKEHQNADELQLLGKLEWEDLVRSLGKLEIAGVVGKTAELKWQLLPN
jgi:DNA processing protein